MITAVLCTVAYLIGSIPTGLLVARARGVDVRRVGSGNIGATNVARAVGRGWAIAVLIGDALKGFAPVFVGRVFLPQLSPWKVALAGLCAVIGHMFTVFLRGRGGKGVATSWGVSLAISPLAGLCAFGVYLIVYLTLRISSLGSLLGLWSFSLFAQLVGGITPPYVALAIAASVLVTIRHRQNIGRLLRGEEKRA